MTRKPPPPKLVAMVAPAVRTVFIEVVPQENANGGWDYITEYHPVVALAGLTSEDGYPRFEPIIMGDPIMGLVLASDAECENTVTQTVICPWEPSEDEERLAGTVRAMTRDLARTLTRLSADNGKKPER